MAKNKKKKKSRNKKISGLKNITIAQLFQQGEELINNSKPRDAIAALKMAAKKGGPQNQINQLLFKAYSLRAVQLRDKGMDAEADEVLNHAFSRMSSYNDFTDEELLVLIKAMDLQKSVSVYADFLSVNKPSAKIEQHLAERFLIRPQWDLLDGLGDRISLKKEISPVMAAVNQMIAGEWESAMECLKPIPRSSPWSTTRMLCHAMVCFYKEDDPGMRRALSMIPKDSALQPIAEKLLDDIQSVSCLWEGPVHLAKYISAVFDEFRARRYNNAGNYIRKIAATISSRNQDIAIFHLVELLWGMVTHNQIKEYDFIRMAHRLLTKPMIQLMDAKMDCFMGSSGPFHQAAVYLSVLDFEFPDPKDRDMAETFVLLHAIKVFKDEFAGVSIAGDDGARLKHLLNLTAQNMRELVPELIVHAISRDPGNRESYEMLAALPSSDRKSYQWIETGLLEMKSHFPDDPYPCLALAKLYYRKNAYRKAENILKEAMIRAPHDIHVMNMHVMSLLISAEKNIKRGKFNLARRDIDRASEISTPDTRFLVVEKQILLQSAGRGQLSLFGNRVVTEQGDVRRAIEELTRFLTVFECLRVLGALLIDGNRLSQQKLWDKKMIRVVDQALKNQLESVSALTPLESYALLKPLDLDLPVIAGNDMAHLFIERSKGILDKVDDHHILPVFDNLIRTRHYKPVFREIKRRKKTADERFCRMLDFYEVFLKHLDGKLYDEGFRFSEIIDDVPPSDQESFRAAARRLSVYASDNASLRKALETFDFRYLDRDRFFDDIDEYDEEDAYYNDDYDDDESLNRSIIAQLEEMIVEADLIGASKKSVLKFKDFFVNGPVPFPLSLDILGKSLDEETISEMSRELRIILFGHV